MPRPIPVMTPTRNPISPTPTRKQRLRTAATSTPVVLFVAYTASIVLLAALSSDDVQEMVAAMSYYFLGSIALYVAKGAR